MGFFDDSGKESDAGNRIVCVAGYLAHTEFWNMFASAWNQNLMLHGISQLHMKDFMHDQGEYASRGWGWQQKRQIIEGFMTVIKSTRLVGFGVALDADAWRKVPKELIDREGNAQQFCFLRIMRMVVERMKISAPRDVVSVIFDCDQEFSSHRFRRFVGARSQNPDANQYLQGFTVAEPKTFFPLQAADLLAWETRKELMRKLGGFESRPEYDFLFQTLPDMPPIYESELWNQEEISKGIMPHAKPR